MSRKPTQPDEPGRELEPAEATQAGLPDRIQARELEAWADDPTGDLAPTEPRGLIDTLHAHGRKAGLAISPETPAESVLSIVDAVDQVMVMTVHPGFGGQALIPECVEKVRMLARRLQGRVDIEVDGGISETTIAETAAAGASIFVAGTAVFGRADRTQAVAKLRSLAEAAAPRIVTRHTSH